MALCNKFADTPWGPLQLEQVPARRPRFRVTYGKQVQSDLCYADAAKAYGEAIMHYLGCEGMLDSDSFQREGA